MPDTWRCECGYTNLGSKACLVCRRPRQAVPPPRPEALIDDSPPPVVEEVEDVVDVEERPKRPLKAKSATKKAAPRKRSK